MAERSEVGKWRADNLLTDDFDFAYVFPNFDKAYLNAGKAVAKFWSKARILASPEISANEARFNEIEGTVKKIREVDRWRDITITKSKLSNAPFLRQPGESVGWNDDIEDKTAFVEPLVQLMTDSNLGNPDFTAAAIECRVREVINATGTITLYKAVTTAAELKKYLVKQGIQFGRDELDSNTIASFLLQARAQRRAGVL